ncbi:MAG TPA: helix-turn-helix transcriptional regulator [Dehalococcoidia bacterium]|nr:helix-turn-helix transcriptional regulator [Dehalococcoidia bacterium]
MTKRRSSWDANGVKALRRHLQMTQEELAREMGTRQQTISEWETGMYRPRGISERLLGMVAERAGFAYGDAPDEPADTDARAGSS